jgi:AcrR family transcriptional regulator
MSDIVAATGLSKSSLYNTFGSKDELFEAALNRYVDHRAGIVNEVLQNGEAGLADIETLFDALLAEVFVMDDHRGCLAINTSTELGGRDQNVVAVSARFRSIMRTGLENTLGRAAEQGEIDPARVDSYVGVLLSFIIGMAVIVRSGAENDEIVNQMEAARSVIEAWRLK